MMAAPELLAAKPYAEEMRKAIVVEKKKVFKMKILHLT